MNRTLLISLTLMIVAGFLFTYFTSEIVELKRGHLGSPLLFTISRTGLFALVAVIVVTVPLLVARRGRKKFTAGPLIAMWLAFSLLNLAAWVGERLP